MGNKDMPSQYTALLHSTTANISVFHFLYSRFKKLAHLQIVTQNLHLRLNRRILCVQDIYSKSNIRNMECFEYKEKYCDDKNIFLMTYFLFHLLKVGKKSPELYSLTLSVYCKILNKTCLECLQSATALWEKLDGRWPFPKLNAKLSRSRPWIRDMLLNTLEHLPTKYFT